MGRETLIYYMILFLLAVEVWISVILCVAATGCITALYSWVRISSERKKVRACEIILTGDDAWSDAYPHDADNLRAWFRNKAIREDSHLGDFIRTCWSTWLAGKPISFTELHTLVARRERSYKATRLSAGIAGLLLVFGIMGTLSAVKPVLEKFQIQVAEQSVGPDKNETGNDSIDQNLDDSRDAAYVAKNADKVNILIKNLGGAFSPSLFALFGTICVVACRGLYSQAFYKYSLELDRFAVDKLIPRYRIMTISEQFENIRVSMSQLAESIIQRDSNFENVVEKLDNIVENITPALEGLNGAAKACMESVEALTNGSASIANALSQHLGASSSIHRAIKGLDKTYTDVESWFKNLTSISETINQSNTASKKQINEAIKAIAKFLNTSVKDFEADRGKMTDAIDSLKNDVLDIPDQIKTTSENATKQAINVVEKSNQEQQRKFFERHSNYMEAVKTSINTEVQKIDKASASLVHEATKINSSIKSLHEINKDIKKSIKEVSFAESIQVKDIAAKSQEIKLSNSDQLSNVAFVSQAIRVTDNDEPETSDFDALHDPSLNPVAIMATNSISHNDKISNFSDGMVSNVSHQDNDLSLDHSNFEAGKTLIVENEILTSESIESNSSSFDTEFHVAKNSTITDENKQYNTDNMSNSGIAPVSPKKPWWSFSNR